VPTGTVCVAIVTYNSGRYIRRCLEAALRQKGVPLEIVVVDNASTDGTLEILREFGGRIRILRLDRNVGFAEAQNRAIRSSTSEWVLSLNPDVLLRPGFIGRLVDAGQSDPGAGTVCGKLFSIGPGFQALPETRIDSTGIFFTPSMRHFDRGWRQPDGQSFECVEYVFGASAAAALYRRAMIEDVSIEGDFFDPDFFVYREDADVAWRAILMGWRSIYTPAATAYHVRTVTPGNRRSVPALINMHSVKNRFLMRIKNATAGLYRRHGLAMTLRDLIVIGACLFWEPASLPAFWHVARLLPRALHRRRLIMSRRRAGDAEMAQWFSFRPMAIPIEDTMEVAAAEPGAAASRPRHADPLPAADYVA
jgi:GT2 family glycosyltransferase